MKIRSDNSFGELQSRFDANAAKETLRELDEQYANGELERRTYFEKKRSLVQLFIKATTNPRRKHREENFDGD
ncbi:hypothetical protein ICM05_00990 [Leucobacter sp. cx-42]|uniref:hypothetical protein n=1 Tax=unclassified Leucobacter TaxID=2621730 RepID=UPI00165DD980|nr:MULTISPECIES: hypothetical protein [unclassified Leucobacter]MBC9953223.1 hypothetical protein [Leucobacter sp. cx-42]